VLTGGNDTLTDGVGFTITVDDAMFTQLWMSVPVTVYVVVVDVVGATGLTVCAAVTTLLLQLYVLPPPAISTELDPVHMLDGLALVVIVGNGYTVTVVDAVFVHPCTSVPVTI
jgi:hypothetical protein